MDGVKIIEFDEQQKARLTAALTAAALELVQPETVDSKPGEMIDLPYTENENKQNANQKQAICGDEWKFLCIKKELEMDTLDSPAPLKHKTLISAKYEVHMPTAQSAVAAAVVTPNKGSDVDIMEKYEDSDEEDMDVETEIKLKELLESDTDDDDDAPANQMIDSGHSVVTSYSSEKNIDKLMHYICPQCNHACGSLKKWRAHTYSEHNFNTIEQLNMRRLVDREGNMCYQCNDCQKQFSQSVQFSSLLDHRITHLPYPNYIKCRVCGVRFLKRGKLLQHLKGRKHEKIYMKYLNLKPKCQHLELHCALCDDLQENRKQWKAHLNEVHNYAAIIAERFLKADEAELYCCILCKKTVGQFERLRHAVTHERYKHYKCKLCCNFRSFDFARSWIHVRKTHFREPAKVWVCPYCELKFLSNKSRNKHLRNTHCLDKLKCEVCEQQFSFAASLLAHMNKSKHHRLDGEVVAVDEQMQNASDEESSVTCNDKIVKEETKTDTKDGVVLLPDAAEESRAPTEPMISRTAKPKSDPAVKHCDFAGKRNKKTTNKLKKAAINEEHIFYTKDCSINSNDSSQAAEMVESNSESDVEEMNTETDTQTQSAEEDNEQTHNTGGTEGKSNNQIKSFDQLMDYTCPQCNHACGSFQKWRAHTSNEHNFNSIEHLNMRRFNDHAGKLCYHCRDCEQKFNQRTQYLLLLNHRITHLPYADYIKCRLCNTGCTTRVLMMTHIRSKHKKIYNEYHNQKTSLWDYMDLYCPLCKTWQSCRKRWEVHLDKKHNYSAILAQRMPVVENDSYLHSCYECKKRYPQHKCLEHAVTHEHHASFKCKSCPNFSSFDIGRCWTHVLKFHVDKPAKVLHCSYCELTFRSRCVRDSHMQVVHLKEHLRCETCELQFVMASHLLSHMTQSKHHRLDGVVEKHTKGAANEELNCGSVGYYDAIVKEETEIGIGDNEML